MTSWSLILRRARAGLTLVLTILALVTAVTAIIAGTVGYSRAAETVAAREALTGAESADVVALRLQTRQADDPQRQDDRARELIDETFAPAQVAVTRSLASEPRPVQGRDRRIQLVASDNLDGVGRAIGGFKGLIEITDGRAPESGGAMVQGALHTGAAAQWELNVGDVITIDDIDVEITALFYPLDPTAPAWVGDPLAMNGFTDDLVGVMVVPPDILTDFTEPTFAQWVIEPDADNVQPEDLNSLAAAAGALRSTMDTEGVAIRGIRVDGDLAPTAERAYRNLQTARALSVVPLMVLLTVSVIAVAQLARILAAARTGEVEFLLARGASRGQVLRWSLAEVAAVSAIGTGLGMAIATGLLQAVPAGGQQVGTVGIVSTLTGLAVLLALAGVTVEQVKGPARSRQAGSRSGRSRQAAAWGTAILALGAAGLSWAQLRRYGSPLAIGDDGSLRVDYVAGAAPALLLGSAGVVALILFPPLSRLAERVTAPTSGLTTHLSVAHISRGLTSYAVPVVLTVLAVGVTTVSGMYAATSADLRDGLSDLAQGADVRTTLDDQQVDQNDRIATMPPVVEVEGVETAAPVWIRETRVGETDATLLASPMSELAEVAIVPAGAADPAALVERFTDQPGAGGEGIGVPDGSTVSVDITFSLGVSAEVRSALSDEIDALVDFSVEERGIAIDQAREEALSLRFEESSGSTDVSLSLLLQDTSTGVVDDVTVELLQVPLDVSIDESGSLRMAPADGQGSVDIRLPSSVAGYRVVGIDVVTSEPLIEYDVSATIGVLVDGEREPADGSWSVQTPEMPSGTIGAQVPAAEVEVANGGGLVVTREGVLRRQDEPTGGIRLRPTPSAEEPLPLAVTRSIATASDLRVGSVIDINVFGATVPGQVAAVVDAVPGTLERDVVLTDAGVLSRALTDQDADLDQPTEIWAETEDGIAPDDVADLAVVVPGIVSAAAAPTTSVTDATAAVRLVFWVASAGSVLLAVTGIAAVSATSLTTRRPEVAVLRALGMPSGAQARARAIELGSVTLGGLVLGVGAGWLVAYAVIRELASATTLPGRAALPAGLRLELPLWLTLLSVGVSAVVVIVAGLALKVKDQALDRTYREEMR